MIKTVCGLCLAFILNVSFTAVNSQQRFELTQRRQWSQLVNCSGVSFNPQSGGYMMICNNPESIVELDAQGEVLRTIALEGFSDTEAICCVGPGKWAVAAEGTRSISVVEIDRQTARIALDECLSSYVLSGRNERNKGIEGLCFDGEKLYCLTEKSPVRLYVLGFDGVKITSEKQLFGDFSSIGDASGLTWRNGEIFVLSDESRCLRPWGDDGLGEPLIELGWFANGLTRAVRQPEGVCFNADGELIIISEPNHFYRFKER